MVKYITLILSLCITLSVRGAHYYGSSSSGSDGNPGTLANPFASIAKINSLSLSPGDTVSLKGGDSFNGVLYITHSGTSGSPIVVNSYGTGRYIINGFITLPTSAWTSMGNGVYEAYIANDRSNINLVTLDATPQSMGKWPDNGVRSYSAVTSSGLTDVSLTAQSPYNWTGAYVCVYDDFYRRDTTSITAMSGGLTFGSSITSPGTRGTGYFIFNDPRTLLFPNITVGRWYNNYTKDSLQMFFGPTGPNGHTIKVSTSDTLVYASSVSYVTILNGDFEGSNQFTVFQNNTSNIILQNCLFNYGGQNMFTGNNCPYAQFIGDSSTYFNNNGGYITGSSSTHVLLENSYFNHIGGSAGMGKSGTTGTAGYTGWSNAQGFSTVSGNTFLNTAYVAIYFSGDSDYIYNNYIDTFCTVKIDGSGIYSWDPNFQTYTYGRFVYNNVILHGQGPSTGLTYDLTDLSFGLYYDGHSTSITSYNNTSAYNASGGVLVHGSSMHINNNNFFGNLYTQVYLAEASGTALTGLYLKNNILGNGVQGQNLVTAYTPANDLLLFGSVDSNKYIGYTGDVNPFSTQANGGSQTSRNLSGWQGVMTDAHSTLTTSVNKIVYNTTNATQNVSVLGTYADASGNTYSAPIISVSAYQSIILSVSYLGYITLQTSNIILN